MSISLCIGNDNTLDLLGLKNGATDSYINNALVAATLNDANGSPVAGQPWPTALNYVTGSDGVYRVVLEDSLVLIEDDYYQLTIDATGDGLKAHWETQIQAKIRRL